jgi:hypothetical protein
MHHIMAFSFQAVVVAEHLYPVLEQSRSDLDHQPVQELVLDHFVVLVMTV